MQLRVISGPQLENTDMLRAILAECEGEEAADLFLNKGSVTLCWQKAECSHYSHTVRVAIPLRWMRESTWTSELDDIVRYFVSGVCQARK